MRTLLPFIGLLLGGETLCSADQVTINFEDLRVVSASAFSAGQAYSNSGYSFTAIAAPGSTNAAELDYFGTLSTEFYGSTALLACCEGNSTVLTRTDGGTFDLLSIDFIDLPGNFVNGVPTSAGPGAIMLVGMRPDGTTISYDATFPTFPGAGTTRPLGFTDLSSVSWVQGGAVCGGTPPCDFQFDNVVVATPVPEPSSLIVEIGECLLLLLCARRRFAISSGNHYGNRKERY
jgi:hypothetical protein